MFMSLKKNFSRGQNVHGGSKKSSLGSKNCSLGFFDGIKKITNLKKYSQVRNNFRYFQKMLKVVQKGVLGRSKKCSRGSKNTFKYPKMFKKI
jgi:hypothetical protein